jgi:hypothetical protein
MEEWRYNSPYSQVEPQVRNQLQATAALSRDNVADAVGQRFPSCAPTGALSVLWGARVFYMRNIFILKEMWAQDKIYILVGTFIG